MLSLTSSSSSSSSDHRLVAVVVVVVLVSQLGPPQTVRAFVSGSNATRFIVCSSSTYHCADGKCIPLSWVCDNNLNCHGGEDEGHCDTQSGCDKKTKFQCDNGTCISREWVCDGVVECDDDGSDELNCENYTCPDMFQCIKGGSCIFNKMRCDHNYDCANKADEIGCQYADSKSCNADQFYCDGGCIVNDWRCDGDIDCDDKTDELDCPCNSLTHFNCTDMLSCINKDRLCDHTKDCADGSDEKDCEDKYTNEGKPCMKDHFKCGITNKCMHNKYRCDGAEDCDDGSDEALCMHTTCANGTFMCHTPLRHNSTHITEQCIVNSARCNGIDDCNDGSDELEADGNECKHYSNQCTSAEFDCRDDGTECVPKSDVCDQKNDCTGGEDEATDICSQDNTTCHLHNGGCEQLCTFDYEQRCACYPGFKLDIDDVKCVDINECEIKGMCSQKCENVPERNYTCSCFENYHSNITNAHLCVADGEKASLLFAHKTDIRLYQPETRLYTMVANKTINAIAIDYDYDEGFMYWTSMRMSIIYRQPIFNSSNDKREIVLSSGIDLSDGIAFDWIHKNLYWTDTGLNKIGMMSIKANPERNHKILFNYDLDEPRSIIVDPREDQGWFYWTDWGKTPSIEKAGLDGSMRRMIFSGQEIEWANGLTIDYTTNHLYWCDAKLNSIRRIDLDGSNVKLILHSYHLLRHPFSITVFQDSLYWTDWNSDSINSASKFNGTNAYRVHKVSSPMGIVVHHRNRQPQAKNRCSADINGGCSDICTPRPDAGGNAFTCLCTSGRELGVDFKTCNQVVHHTTIANDPHGDKSKHSKYRGFIIFMTIVLVLCSFLLIGMVAKKMHLRMRGKPLNFENTIYRKTTNQISIDTSNEYFHSTNDRIPLTSEPIFAQTDTVSYADT